MTLKQASTKQWVKKAEEKLPGWPECLRVINEQLWCCCGDAGLVVFDSELQPQRSLLVGDMKCIRDVAQMSNGDVIIAAATGLFHISDGECKRA